MAGIDFSSFFGSANSMFSDYAAIRNGSYKRLLKSYYGAGSSGVSGSSSGSSSKAGNTVLDRMIEERRNPKVSESVAKANSDLTTGVSNLKSSIATLTKEDTFKSTDGKTIEEKSVSALKNYVDAYNSTIEAAKKSTNSGMTHHVADMMKTTTANADALSEIGITVKKDGTLSLNESKAKSADWQLTRDLFSSDDRTSYGSAVSRSLTGAGYYATSTSSSTSGSASDAASESTKSTVESYGDLKSNIDALKSGDYDSDSIAALVSDFARNYNSLLGSARLSTNEGVAANLGNLLQKTKDHNSSLKDIGISVDKNGNLSVDEKKLSESDEKNVKSALKDYAKSIETSASLVKYYATTNSGTASGYTSNGTYGSSWQTTSYTNPFSA